MRISAMMAIRRSLVPVNGRASGKTQNSVFDLKGATLLSKLDSLFEASWRDGSH